MAFPNQFFRQIQMEVRINGTVIPQVLWTRCRFSFAEPVATAQFMAPLPYGNYDNDVEIRSGATPGHGLLLRFKGKLRNKSGELWPRAVTHNVVGTLQKAAEFVNGEVTKQSDLRDSVPIDDPLALGMRAVVGGLLIPDLLGRSAPWTEGAWVATSDEIVAAVLSRAGLQEGTDYSRDDINGSNVVYGRSIFPYLWNSGTPTVDNVTSQLAVANVLGARQAGETALSYIHRYDEIDAEWGGVDSAGVSSSGGFYRTSEGLGGRIYRWKIGGRPSSNVTFTFREGVNILDGTIERQYPLGNRMLVTGGDWGGLSAPMFFAAIRSNPLMGNRPFYAPNAPSSPMIEWSTRSMQPSAEAVGYSGKILGQSCETVAEAALIEANRETPTGHIVTADDFPFTQGHTVWIEGAGGTVDRLLAKEPFWIQGLTIDCGYGTEGEPLFTQTLEVQGGGLDPAPPPP